MYVHVMRFAVLVYLIASTGCMTAAKQAYYGVTGSQGEFYEVQVVDPVRLADYQSVRVEPFTNDLGAHVPAKVVQRINDRVPAVLAEAELFYPDGRALAVSGRVIHFTGKSDLVGAIGSVIGGSEVCVCRVQLRDGSTGERIGEAVCWGQVKSAIRRGSTEHGEGVGKAVAKWIRKRMPDAELEARREAL